MVFLSRDLSAGDATVAQMRSDCQTVSGLVADVTMQAITRMHSGHDLYFTSARRFRPFSGKKREFKTFGNVLNCCR